MKRVCAMSLGLLSIVVALPQLAIAAGGGPAGGSMPSVRELSPQEMARQDYNDGVRSVKRADKYSADAAKQTREDKKAKAAERATKQYANARAYFARAVTQDPKMHEAWNYVGYTSRKLGDMSAALPAYEQALKLKPDYAEAIEYRGVAYLTLNRLDDAKTAYMTLFRDNRKLAGQLMDEMRQWVSARRNDPAGVPATQIDGFEQWMAERANIAQQTASLAIDAPLAWR